MDEKQLIASCLKGERLAQKKLYDQYSGKMMGVCLRYANDRETAADLLQDGFVKVFTNLSSYTGAGSFEGWMRRVFVNCALEYIRKNDVMKESDDLDHAAELIEYSASALEELSAQELINVIQQLPTGFKAVFNLFAIEGYSHKEVSEMLQINESTSRSQYTRAKQMLQKKVNDLYK